MGGGMLVLSGIDLPGARDPLGLWSLEPSDAMTFAAQGAGDHALTWRIRLPDSASEAERVLWAGLRTVEEKNAALRTLEAAFPRMAPPLHWCPEDWTADTVLWRGLVLARSMTTAGPTAQTASYALGDLLERGHALFEQLQRLVTHVAWVKTERSGTPIGITQVDWRGDFRTTWGTDVSVEDTTLHLKAVRLALASRLALLQMVTVVIGGALTLAVRASVPGGQILLIPAVYEYVQDVLSAWARIREADKVVKS